MAGKDSGVSGCLLLLGFGLGAWFLMNLALAVIAAFTGWVASLIWDVEWWFAGVCVFFGVKVLIGILDAFTGDDEARCPECDREVLTSLGVRCRLCGGAAKIKGDE